MPPIKTIFLQNKAWVQERLQNNPDYFSDSAQGQTPQFLWIGCSDSRVLPNEITGTSVGDLFVHRNIANLVHADDLNLMCVVTYAVKYLKVKDVIVCGHYGCGGVQAATTTDSFGIIDEWLKNIKDTNLKFQKELDAIQDEVTRFDRLVELNVLQQVENLKTAGAAKPLWDEFSQVRLHGWVYDMRSGRIKNLIPS